MRPWRSAATPRHTGRLIITAHNEPSGPRRPLLLWRSHEQRVIAGVAGGLSERLGVDAVYLRAAVIALSFAGGAGVFAYLLAWTLAEEQRPSEAVVQPHSAQRDMGLGLIVLGLLLSLRDLGFWFGDVVVWPVVLVILGSSVIWSRGDATDHARWTRLASAATGAEAAPGRSALARLALGGVLVVSGVGTFLARSSAVAGTGGGLLAVLITGAGVVLILGPWIVRQAQQLSEERNERIRSQERAEVAAHLHDSVLQTLAMIQRSDSARRMVSLARGQERELRAWLYGADDRQSERLEPVLEELAGRVERLYDMPVELVVVGDTLVDDQMRALTAASYEALQNAAQHSGAESVSMYVEIEPTTVTAFIRDEGKGFDPAALTDGRRGIAHSIVGRMARHGGHATISSEPGEGTEIELQLPRERAR